MQNLNGIDAYTNDQTLVHERRQNASGANVCF
jgi:hypothetical protein